jgi:hypothetical protein
VVVGVGVLVKVEVGVSVAVGSVLSVTDRVEVAFRGGLPRITGEGDGKGGSGVDGGLVLT